MRRVYIIEHLDCANCAAKIERKINELPEVEEATLTFATKQLRVTAKDPDALLEQMRQIARTVEPDATIEPRPVQTAGNRRKVYIIEHLDCANCAAKIERKINELPEVEEATLTFATKQLRVTAKNPDALLEQMRQIARTVEPDATIEPRQSQPGLREATYIIEHLDCANCAAKIERKINELPEVEEATLTFATKQLRVTAKDPDALLEQMRQIARSVEPDATIEPRQKQPAAAAKQAGHKEDDGEKQALWAILAGAALFVLGEVCSRWDMPLVTTGMFLVAYVILGGKVLLTAGKNLTRGHVFDENFLMSLATIGRAGHRRVCRGSGRHAVLPGGRILRAPGSGKEPEPDHGGCGPAARSGGTGGRRRACAPSARRKPRWATSSRCARATASPWMAWCWKARAASIHRRSPASLCRSK